MASPWFSILWCTAIAWNIPICRSVNTTYRFVVEVTLVEFWNDLGTLQDGKPCGQSPSCHTYFKVSAPEKPECVTATFSDLHIITSSFEENNGTCKFEFSSLNKTLTIRIDAYNANQSNAGGPLIYRKLIEVNVSSALSKTISYIGKKVTGDIPSLKDLRSEVAIRCGGQLFYGEMCQTQCEYYSAEQTCDSETALCEVNNKWKYCSTLFTTPSLTSTSSTQSTGPVIQLWVFLVVIGVMSSTLFSAAIVCIIQKRRRHSRNLRGPASDELQARQSRMSASFRNTYVTSEVFGTEQLPKMDGPKWAEKAFDSGVYESVQSLSEKEDCYEIVPASPASSTSAEQQDFSEHVYKVPVASYTVANNDAV